MNFGKSVAKTFQRRHQVQISLVLVWLHCSASIHEQNFKTMVITISDAHFPVKCLLLPQVALASTGLLKVSLKPFKQVYNPTETAPFFESRSHKGVDWLQVLVPGKTS